MPTMRRFSYSFIFISLLLILLFRLLFLLSRNLCVYNSPIVIILVLQFQFKSCRKYNIKFLALYKIVIALLIHAILNTWISFCNTINFLVTRIFCSYAGLTETKHNFLIQSVVLNAEKKLIELELLRWSYVNKYESRWFDVSYAILIVRLQYF